MGNLSLAERHPFLEGPSHVLAAGLLTYRLRLEARLPINLDINQLTVANWTSSLFTVAGPRRIRTGFPFHPSDGVMPYAPTQDQRVII
jgi:hypothetical protein